MDKRIRVVDLSYYYEKTVSDYRDLMRIYEPGSGHHAMLGRKVDLHVIRFLNQDKTFEINGVHYYFKRGNSSKAWLPLKFHRDIKALGADIILLHGFLNPLQVLLLKWQVKKPLVIQYHGGGIPHGVTGFMNRLVKQYVKHYVFTAETQAKEFIDNGTIANKSVIFEIMEGSTLKRRKDKREARERLGINEKEILFLWVGRLDENKDPLTVLNGFGELCRQHKNLRLYMIYNDEKLLKQVELKIRSSELLSKTVVLLGKVPHEELDWHYSSADIFVLGSHYEGSGFALCEAMACGCIPVVTNIPSFSMMTNQGTVGCLWKSGDSDSFRNAAETVLLSDLEKGSRNAVAFFEKTLSFEAIANKHVQMIHSVLLK